jgi:hypothetical protein
LAVTRWVGCMAAWLLGLHSILGMFRLVFPVAVMLADTCKSSP